MHVCISYHFHLRNQFTYQSLVFSKFNNLISFNMSEKEDKRTGGTEDRQAAKEVKTNDEVVPSTNLTSAIVTVKLTEEEKLKKRAERFGLSSEKLPSTAHELTASSDDKLKQRAMRFSLNETKTKVTLTPIKPKSSEEIKKASDALSKRKQRFGDMLIDQNTGPEAKKQMRAQRFGVCSTPNCYSMADLPGFVGVRMEGNVRFEYTTKRLAHNIS